MSVLVRCRQSLCYTQDNFFTCSNSAVLDETQDIDRRGFRFWYPRHSGPTSTRVAVLEVY